MLVKGNNSMGKEEKVVVFFTCGVFLRLVVLILSLIFVCKLGVLVNG